MKTLRASSLPLLFKCAGSLHNAKALHVDAYNAAGDVGTEVHALLAEYVRTGEVVDLEEKDAEVRFLALAGKRWWDQYGHNIGDPKVEQSYAAPLGGWQITGTPDIASISDNIVTIVDFKSTRLFHLDYTPQLVAYGWLILNTLKYAEDYRLRRIIVYLRDDTHEVIEVTKEQRVAWAAKLAKVLIWDGVYHPGPQCSYCPIHLACPTHTAAVRQGIEALVPLMDALPAEPNKLILAYQQAQAAEKLIAGFREALRCQIEKTGPIDAGDFVLEFREVNGTQVIDPQAAWPILTQYLATDELARVVSVQKGKLLDAIAAKAERGVKGKARGQILNQLKEAGAITVKPTSPRLTLVRKEVLDGKGD